MSKKDNDSKKSKPAKVIHLKSEQKQDILINLFQDLQKLNNEIETHLKEEEEEESKEEKPVNEMFFNFSLYFEETLNFYKLHKNFPL